MAKKRGRKPVKKTESNVVNVVQDEQVPENNGDAIHAQEVERQATAIRALREVEIEQLRTMLHLLRSYFKKEQLQVPVMQFFKENLPNLSIVKNESKYDVQWKDNEGSLYMDQADAGNIHASLLHRLSMVYQDFPAAIPSLGGLEVSNRSVKTSLFGADSLQIKGFDLEAPSDMHIFEWQDKFQTPGATNHSLSIGMTPKTLRLPKPGEMLLSVHGSPLGVYKEDNMEAINEMEDD